MADFNKSDSDYQYTPITTTLNGKKLTLVGVEHTPSFFKENQCFFERIIAEHDAVILEVSKPSFFEGDDSNFFKSIGNLAFQADKKIYQTDPMSDGLFYSDITNGAIGAILIKASLKYQSSENDSRRNFLKRLGKAAFGLSLIGGFAPAKSVLLNTFPSTLSYGLDDKLELGVCDYRNIVTADGIDRLCKEASCPEKLVLIYGAGHHAPIYEYLKDSNKRRKRLAYLPQELVGNTKVREYNPTKSGWQLTRAF